MWAAAVFVLFLGLSCTECRKHLPFTTCDRDYQKLGCLSTSDRVTTKLLISDRAHDSKHVLQWGKMAESVHSLACRCLAKAKAEGYQAIGIRNFAECWGVKKDLDMKKFATPSGDCVNTKFKSCDNAHAHECVGKGHSEYIYKLTSAAPTEEPSVDGGFSEWSQWTECSKTCGQGTKSRERVCNNPMPAGRLGKDCSALGSTTDVMGCTVAACPTPSPAPTKAPPTEPATKIPPEPTANPDGSDSKLQKDLNKWCEEMTHDDCTNVKYARFFTNKEGHAKKWRCFESLGTRKSRSCVNDKGLLIVCTDPVTDGGKYCTRNQELQKVIQDKKEEGEGDFKADVDCPRIKVSNAYYGGNNGYYERSDKRVSWDASRPTYKHVSKNRWVYWNKHGYGWSIGPSFAGYYYYSKNNELEPFQKSWIKMNGMVPKIECLSKGSEPEKIECQRIEVKNANYGGCSDIYYLNEKRVSWDSERPTYKNSAGNRWVYWNAHGYGWSIGPAFGKYFYYGSRTADGAEPWLGKWSSGVKVTCLSHVEECQRVQLTGAPYAGCNGYYDLTDKVASDKKRPVYKKKDSNRYIHWMRHGYGWAVSNSNFGTYFYYGGSGANGAEPFLGKWRGSPKVVCVDPPAKE